MLKIKLQTNKEFNSLYELMKYYFSYSCPETYYENDTLQCENRRNRSFSDLFALARYYFPDVKIKELAEVLMDLTLEKICDFFVCKDVRSPVFFYYSKGGGMFSRQLNYNDIIYKCYEYYPNFYHKDYSYSYEHALSMFTKTAKEYEIKLNITGLLRVMKYKERFEEYIKNKTKNEQI
jgi:hypothetical protein